MAQPVVEMYFRTPVVTRFYMTACFLTTLATRLDIVDPLHLYYNLTLVWQKHQIWRVVTNFLYFGDFGIDFVFHMFFLERYCRGLEEGSFRGRTADFLYMLLLGAVFMTVIAPFFSYFGQLYFMGSALTFMVVYVWSRRVSHQMALFDVVHFRYVLVSTTNRGFLHFLFFLFFFLVLFHLWFMLGLSLFFFVLFFVFFGN